MDKGIMELINKIPGWEKKQSHERYEKEFINFSHTADFGNDLGTERRNHYEEV